MGGRAGDGSRLPAPEPPSHQSSSSTSYRFSPRPSSQAHKALRDGSSADHGSHRIASSTTPGRSETPLHPPHYYPATGDLRQTRDLPVPDQPPRSIDTLRQARYERGRGERRSASPLQLASSARPRSSSPPFRIRTALGTDNDVRRMHGGSADSEGFQDSVKSEDPLSYHRDGDRSQRAGREESDKYQQPEDMDATMSSVSEPTSRARSPHKRRTRMLMSRNQWQALSRLWDRTIFPATAERESLAREIGLTPRQVQVWFQNQRQKRRRERETDAANAALVASSPYFAAARTAELPHGWNGGPPPRHWIDAEDGRSFVPPGSRLPGLPGPHSHNGFEHPRDGMPMNHGYDSALRVRVPRQRWPELDAQRWRSSHMPCGEREFDREYERGALARERAFERGHDFVPEPSSERDESLSSRPRGHYYAGAPPPEHREDRWQQPPRPTLSPHHSYAPPPQAHYSGRESRSPHPPWQPSEPGGPAATERTASPGMSPTAGVARHPVYYAPDPRPPPAEIHQRSRHSESSPAPGQLRGPSFLPPSLSALAIDRPLDRDVRGRRLSHSYVGDEGRGAGSGAPDGHRGSHYPHPAPAQTHPSPPEAGSLHVAHSREPRPHEPTRTSETTSPRRLPSLSSLLH